MVFIFTFDQDPGRLSAAFAHQGLRRALAGGARYVAGGWSTLVDLLAERAAGLGAQIRIRTRVPVLPAGPTILATGLATARVLTGDRSLTWPSARTATFDLGLRADCDPDWFRAMDLDDRIYAARYSLADLTLAPPGHELIQIAAACAPRERKADAEHRVQRLLDQSWPGWRAAVEWYRSALRTQCTGAVDLPGTTWHDRPAVSRGNGLTMATDQLDQNPLGVVVMGTLVKAASSTSTSTRPRRAGRVLAWLASVSALAAALSCIADVSKAALTITYLTLGGVAEASKTVGWDGALTVTLVAACVLTRAGTRRSEM